MRHTDERAIAEFRQELAAVYLTRYGLAALTVWAFVYGTAVLALRGGVGLSRLDVVWGLCSLPLALGPAIYLALRRLPARQSVRAALDRHGHCGGLLMAGAETKVGGWDLPEKMAAPRMEWRGRRLLLAFTLALAFVALGFAVPQSVAALGGQRLDVSREVARLEEQLEVLQREKVIDAEKVEALKMELSKLKRQASGKDPVKTLEALDNLQDQVRREAEKAAEDANKSLEDISRAEAMNDALREKGGKLTDEQMKQALTKMAELIRKAAEENDLLDKGLDPDVRKAIEENKLTPEILEKIAKALKKGKDGTEMKVAELVRAKLVDADALKKADKAMKIDAGELTAYLKENGLDSETADKLGEDQEGGKGGTDDDGTSKTKLTFGDESSEEGVKYKEEELPPGEQQNLRDSLLSGISQGAPNIGKEKAVMGGNGALDKANAGGGSASTQTLLPRHKAAVERYFDRASRMKK